MLLCIVQLAVVIKPVGCGKVHIAHVLIAYNTVPRGGAQVACYAEDGCMGFLENSDNSQICCMLTDSVTFESGEVCHECLGELIERIP